MQPDGVQRTIAHVAFTRCGGRHTFVFRPSFAFTLPLWTLWAAYFSFFSQLGDLKPIPVTSFLRHHVQVDERTFLEDISREEGGADVRFDERAESLTVRRNRRLREEISHVGSRRANVHWKIHAHSSMTRTRKAKERDVLVHLLRQAHRTQLRKVMEKVVMTRCRRHTKTYWLKSVRKSKQTTVFGKKCQESVRWEIPVITGMFLNVPNSNL